MVHYVRNLLGIVSLARPKQLGVDLRGIFAATSREQEALRITSSVAKKWREKGNLRQPPLAHRIQR
jgi:transposase-like protein